MGAMPNPIEWLLISDVEDETLPDVIDHQQLYLQMKHLVRCPTCGRLYIYWDGGYGKEPQEYVPCEPPGS